MITKQVIITFIISLVSVNIGVLFSTYHYRSYENRKVKFETIKKLIGNRYDLKGDQFTQALNEIVVVFNESEDVMKALSDHHKAVTSGENSEDELMKLLKAICNDLGLKISSFNDSFFLKPYIVKSSMSINKSNE